MFTTRTTVNPTRTNVRRQAIRASVAAALVAPLLMIGASASMASSTTETKSHEVSDVKSPSTDHVTTAVSTSCAGSKVAFTVTMSNDGGPRSVRVYVIEVDGAVVHEEEMAINTALGKIYEAPAGKQYQVMVTENDGPGTPFHTSYDKAFDTTTNGLCKPISKPKVATSTDCNVGSAYLHVTLTSGLGEPDAYEISAYNSKGIAGHTGGVLAPNGTITWTMLMTEDVTDVVVSTSSQDENWSIGGFTKPTCTDTADDSDSGEGPKDPHTDTTPTTVPTTKPAPTTTTPPVTIPPLTVPPTEVPPTTIPSTEPEVVVTTTVANVPATYSIPDPADLGIPVRVLGELVTAQPAVAAQATDPAPLAFTGADTGLLAAIASVFMIGGGGLVVIARRRPKN